MNFRIFTAEKVIIHEVPRRFVGGPAAQLTLSAQAEDLSGMAKLKPFFERKVRGSLDRQGFDVERDPSNTSRVPDLVAEVIGDESKLVAASQAMAEQLHHVQTGVNPAGLLCVTIGKVGSKAALAVLKVEREEGARVQAQGSGGQRSLTMSYLDDLMITGKTRIFKASLFTLRGTTAASLEGRVADDQRGPEYGAEVASFFLSSFLGCRLKSEPRVATKEVFLATEDFINDEVDEPEHKARYAIALSAQMHATTRDLRPRDFAETNFELDDRRAYRDYLNQRGIDPDQAIEKDTALIENRLRKVRVDTEHNLVVMGPSDELDARMDVSDDRLVIRDRVVRTRGG